MPTTSTAFTESEVEAAALEYFASLGYATAFGPDLAPDGTRPERESYHDVVLRGRLIESLTAINTHIPPHARDEAVRQAVHLLLGAGLDSPSLLVNNHRFHRFLVEGVPVEYQHQGRTVHDRAWLVDFSDPARNDWLAVNQFTVVEAGHNRRPDIVVFVNGLPLAVIELKNPGDDTATVRGAYNQLQTYKQEIPALFPYNEALVVSDGVEARIGTLTSEWDRFMPWRTVDGEELAPKGTLELHVLIHGVFERRRFLDLLRSFIVFETAGAAIVKKMAGYHQFHAVNRAVEATLKAVRGDRRAGVVWHTQGSGKSLTMTFYAGKIIREPAMENPTLVVITDRNDLDGQLFDAFALDHELLRQTPVQAESREHLKELLQVASGGVVFTTVQKFFPARGERYPRLSDRRNIVVIADEAHRSQYDFIDGFARHMRDALPNASFIGFTGTPLEASDRNTKAVFGEYVDVYDIQQAVEDGATVPIYYEGRLARLELSEEERPRIDPEFEEITEGEELEAQEKLKTKWARLEAMVGSERRIALVARDIVEHFERRQESLAGKGMIVCMSRRICVDLYDAIVKLRPGWEAAGKLKVVMTGSPTDPPDWQRHIRTKAERQELAKAFKRAEDPFELVIVRDMWLTGFDAPSLHTIYLDKPMRGHGLLQAIARVNRVFKDKPGGLVVDYLGLAEELKDALAAYTSGGGRGRTAIDQADAVAVLLEKYEVVAAMFHGFDYRGWVEGSPSDRLALLPPAMEHILGLPEGKERFLQAVTELSLAFALAGSHDQAIAIRDEVGFFQTVRGRLAKVTVEGGKTQSQLDTAIRQLVSKAVAPAGVVDIFEAAGLAKPDLSILSGEFLAEVRSLPQKNLAVELLRKLLSDEIKTRSRRNVVQARSFEQLLDRAVRQYQNRLIESAQVIEQLIQLAQEIQAADRRGEDLGLTEAELAFYDALATGNGSLEQLGDATLKAIARELVEKVRSNASIDWTMKESVRARLRVMVRNSLRRHRYPPDKQEAAVITILRQAELFAEQWAA